jgi:hypothetical protein
LNIGITKITTKKPKKKQTAVIPLNLRLGLLNDGNSMEQNPSLEVAISSTSQEIPNHVGKCLPFVPILSWMNSADPSYLREVKLFLHVLKQSAVKTYGGRLW